MSNTALVILHEGFEEMEAVAPIDILRRGEVSVTVASLKPATSVTGRNQITIEADTDLDQALTQDYDVIVLPGGPGVTQYLRHDSRVRKALLHQVATGRLIAAICAAPLAVRDAELLGGKHFTAHPSTQAELPTRNPDLPVVTDGWLITSQGAGTATAFALEILARLTSNETAAAVADSICLHSPQ